MEVHCVGILSMQEASQRCFKLTTI